MPATMQIAATTVAIASAVPRTQAPANVAVAIAASGEIDAILASIASVQEHAAGAAIHIALTSTSNGAIAALQARAPQSTPIHVVGTAAASLGAAANAAIDAAIAQRGELEHVLVLLGAARLRPGTLPGLRTCAAHHGRAGVIGCRVLAPDGTVHEQGPAMPNLERGPRREPPSGGATEFEAATIEGAGMLVDAAPLRKGLRFCTTIDDCALEADFCHRARQVGRSVWITRAATVERIAPRARDVGEMNRRHCYQLGRGRVALAMQHQRGYARLKSLCEAFVLAPLGAAIRTRRVGWLPAYCAGCFAGLRRPQPPA